MKALEALRSDAQLGRLEQRYGGRPVLRVSSNRRSGAQYGMFFGAGLLRRAIELTHRIFPEGRNHGVWGVGLVAGTLLTKLFSRPTQGILTPDKIDIQVDGETLADSELYLAFATSLQHLFLRLNPFWGTGPGPVRFTTVANNAQRLPTSALGILRGRPGPFVTPEHGYTSRNADRVELRLHCGFTVDGELFDPEAGRYVSVSAEDTVRFLRV